ncbi:helix-turn-helix domain-containing protein [Maribacter litopenaei]|uniref:Helix-turn-helix domain-containing protein n=1 Tax=Maribacter litopenaei TaxID=2976127 RepID=A0ABY5Y8S9_9FLAO|nr:helix-turn-helix domain-containing protein [Maribacter litopenaei]UWX55448.1 helix-turn-helix domain-containing protein [Maribacter litopenaei]
MNKSSKILVTVFITIHSFVFSQKQKNDSISDYFNRIEKLVSETKNQNKYEEINTLTAMKDNAVGKEKADILLQLCHLYKYRNIEIAKSFNKEALTVSQELNYQNGIYKAKYNMAYLFFIQGDFNRSMEVIKGLEQAISYRKYPETYAEFETLKSDIHTEKGEYDRALETGLKLLDIAENTGNEFILSKAHAALSHYYLRLENYQKALEHCLKGLDYIIKQKDTHYIFQKVDEIARMSAKLGDREAALKAYDFYLKIEKELYSPGSYIQSIVYMNMADIYMSNGDYKLAQNYLDQAITMVNANNYRFRLPRALMIQAELYLKSQDTASAIFTYEKSIDAAENINAFDVIKSNSLILMDLYKRMDRPDKVSENKILYDVIKDSLFNNEKEQRIIILETRRKIKEAGQKQQALELENESQKAKLTAIITALVSFLVIGLFIGITYVKIKEKNRVIYRRTIENLEAQLNTNSHTTIIKKSDAKIDDKTNTVLDENVKDIILERLKKLEKEHFFIDSNCNLHQLAEKLKTNPKYLSQVINIEKGSNFNNYINELRINYLLTRLVQDEDFRNRKLSYIASSIGYNNLNTFNAAFKKRQGILPSYFIKQLNEES